MTLDDVDELRSLPNTIHVVTSSLSQSDMAALPGEAGNTDNKNLSFDPTCDAISDDEIKFSNIFGKVEARSYQMPYWDQESVQ